MLVQLWPGKFPLARYVFKVDTFPLAQYMFKVSATHICLYTASQTLNVGIWGILHQLIITMINYVNVWLWSSKEFPTIWLNKTEPSPPYPTNPEKVLPEQYHALVGLPFTCQFFSNGCLPYVDAINMVALNAARSSQLLHVHLPQRC